MELGDLQAGTNLEGVDLEAAVVRYSGGCPRCGGRPCTCEPSP